ncbi:MAG: glycosyltransferase family 39 protein [bacterium]
MDKNLLSVNNGWSKKHQQTILFFLILFLGIFLRLYNLGKECLWFDEAITYFRAVLGFSEIIKNSYGWDVHPPTYYLIIHFVVQLGNSEIFLRLFSTLCGIAALPLFYSLTNSVLGKREAIIATLFLALSVFHIRYSQEARVYSFFFLVSLISFLFFYKAVFHQNKQDWFIWAGISILNFYVHYFSLILLTSQIILYVIYSIFIKKNQLSFNHQKWFIYAFILIIIGHIPQFFFFFHQTAAKLNASRSYPHAIHPLYFLLIFGKNLINPINLPSQFLDRNIKYFIGIFIFSGIAAGWKKHKKIFIVTILIVFISLLLSWMSSLFIYFGSGYRFLIFLITPYLLLLTLSVISLTDVISDAWTKIFKVAKKRIINTFKKHLFTGILIIIVAVNLYTIFYYFTNQKKPDWQKGVSHLEKYNSDSTTIISLPEWGDYTVRYYLDQLSYNKLKVRRIKIESTAAMDSLSSEFKNLIFITDGLLPNSQFKKETNKWLKHNATLLWQDSYFPGSCIWLTSKN